uniref:(northern house mosquito) hypothetical protein n=1 Tax=Culex pipiens TaxID=7175 RepID=A0A8D8DW14_CULPI
MIFLMLTACNRLDGRSPPGSSRGTTLDEHDRRKVQHNRIQSAVLANSFQISFNFTRNCPAERQWRFPLNDLGRICSPEGRQPASSRGTTLDEHARRTVRTSKFPRKFPQVLVGRSPTCKFARNEAGRTCSTEGRHLQVPATRRWMNILAGRSPTCKFPRNDARRTCSPEV